MTTQPNAELREAIEALVNNYSQKEYRVDSLMALFQSQQHQLLQGLLEELPEMTLRDVINAEMFPSPEEHKKMVWILETYRNGVKSVIQNKLEGLANHE